jgi:hypothetical protein
VIAEDLEGRAALRTGDVRPVKDIRLADHHITDLENALAHVERPLHHHFEPIAIVRMAGRTQLGAIRNATTVGALSWGSPITKYALPPVPSMLFGISSSPFGQFFQNSGSSIDMNGIAAKPLPYGD